MLNYGSLDNTQLLLYYGLAIEANPFYTNLRENYYTIDQNYYTVG